MGNSRKPSAPIKGQVREMKPLTAEERQEQAARAYAQKRESIATGILFNMMHNATIIDTYGMEEAVNQAVKAADLLIEKLYFTPAED